MSFNSRLTSWFSQYKRDLPWRHTQDPYKIWLSEVILQQTRVAQGMDYYTRFLERFPLLSDLARADEDEVLKLWQGLGYYSRARNLHKGAKEIVEQWGGLFPKDHDSILKIRGIGEYTAAAIASFAFGKCYPVLDGNVARFISRYIGMSEAVDTASGRQQLYAQLNILIDKEDPATFNQAVMEFGALHCKAKLPLCESCPFALYCIAFQEGTQDILPIKKSKTRVKDRYLYYGVCWEKDQLWLHKRKEKDIWQNLYDFPLLDSMEPLPSSALPPIAPEWSCTHLLSHRRLHISFYRVTSSEWDLREAFPVALSSLKEYAFPRPVQEYVEKYLFPSSF